MIIPIHIQPRSSKEQKGKSFSPQLTSLGTEEVVLLELQGELVIEGDPSGQLASTLELGDNNAKPTLRIGHHHLEGKIVNLNKPIAILKKKTQDCDDASSQRQCEYDVVAVVQRKLLFSKRPMPVVSVARTTSSVKESS